MLSVFEVLALLVTSKPGDTYTGVYDDRALASELLTFILVWVTAALVLAVARYRRRRAVATPTPYEAERSTP
jgi:heme/copper-type cytochrome/quinol oxidase subunit 2